MPQTPTHKQARTPRRKRLQLTPAQQNLASIWSVPAALLPDLSVAQLVAVALASTGHDVRALERTGQWYIALDELHRDVPLQTWKRDYAAIVAELARTLTQEVECP